MGRKIFIVFCIALFLTSCANSNRKRLSINKVEHFYISSSHALDLFQILTEPFGLPIVWDYQNWGSFSSGGVTLGNVVIELVESQPEQTQTYYGIALEPNQSLKGTLSFLDSANISHGNIGKASAWSTMSLTNVLPEEINLFLCDYHDREFIRLDRKKATEQLVEHKGGTLGIQFLKEIVIGTQEPAGFENELAKIPGVVKNGSEFHFSEGPNLTLMKSDTSFFSLLIKVKSIEQAKLELDALGLETRMTDQGIEILDEVFPSRVIFEE